MYQRRSPPRLHSTSSITKVSSSSSVLPTPETYYRSDLPFDDHRQRGGTNNNNDDHTMTSTASSMIQQLWQEIDGWGDDDADTDGQRTAGSNGHRSLQSHLHRGWTTDEATQRRERDGGFNVVRPPVDCPAWLCIILPCIKHIPSMRAYANVKPDDSEVLRNSRWVRYDASSLVTGDVIRLEEGDLIPADCIVVHVGDGDPIIGGGGDDDEEEGTAVGGGGKDNDDGNGDGGEELLVDLKAVTGQSRPKMISNGPSCNRRQQRQLYLGGTVVQGRATALVTGIGPKTLLGKLIQEGRFPPNEEVLEAAMTTMPSTDSGIGGTATGIQLGSIS